MIQTHATQFMIDYKSTMEGEIPALQGFIERERDYDLAFCRAWKVMRDERGQILRTATQFLDLMDRVQSAAMSHLPDFKHLGGNSYTPIRGLATMRNYYPLSQVSNSDEEGIRWIIQNIWVEKQPFSLTVFTDDPNHCYSLTHESFSSSKEGQIDFDLKQITDFILSEYQKGLLSNNMCRLTCFVNADHKWRQSHLVELLTQFFADIENCQSEEEKLRSIAGLLRDVIQTHRYWDGNGRSLFMMLNLLLEQSDLEYCYPRNMYFYEGNSIERIVQEIVSGQKRFKEMFGTPTKLSDALAKYASAVEELKELLNHEYSWSEPMLRSFNDRKLNLLFRQSASNPKGFPVLSFLVKNSHILGIDKNSAGESSGTALDVAKRANNQRAIELLQEDAFLDDEDLFTPAFCLLL